MARPSPAVSSKPNMCGRGNAVGLTLILGRGQKLKKHFISPAFGWCKILLNFSYRLLCLQCFDAVGWAAGRARRSVKD